MSIHKRSLIRMSMPYAVSAIKDRMHTHVIAATEDRGPMYTFSPPQWDAVEIIPGPGGCMSLIQQSGAPGRVFTIMQCFPGYQFHDAGIYVLEGTIGKPGWKQQRLSDLPFAHRLEIVDKAESRFLVAASLAATKTAAEDWSKPGTVYVTPLQQHHQGVLQLTPILSGLHKNHGLLVSQLEEKPVLMISAQEGVFLHSLQSSDWEFERVMDHEVSEMQLSDLDDDGVQELVTIEPFHGHLLRVYKAERGAWKLVWEKSLDYGHGLWAGSIRGRKSLVVGNRSGNRDLDLYTVASTKPLTLERQVVDEGVGSANTAVIPTDDADLIFSTNQATREIACYTISEL